MVKQGLFAGLLLAALAHAMPAAAATVEERLIAGLKAQGYVILENGYTWLGRLRIVAETADYHREIVVNPETGEILRDYVVLMAEFAPVSAAAVALAREKRDDHDGLNHSGETDASTLATTDPQIENGDGPGDLLTTAGGGLAGDVAPQNMAGTDTVLLAPDVPDLPAPTALR